MVVRPVSNVILTSIEIMQLKGTQGPMNWDGTSVYEGYSIRVNTVIISAPGLATYETGNKGANEDDSLRHIHTKS